jgi:cytochrome c5
MVDKKSNICKKPMRIYLSSSSNKKEHIGIFGKVGTKNGRFTLPYGTDIDQEKQTILFTDCINNIVQEFDFHGNLIMTIDNKDNHGFGRPVDVKLKNNKIYVVDELKHRVSVFSRDGDHIASYGSRKRLDQNIKYSGQIEDEPFFNLPLGIAVNNSGEMFVVDYGNNRVVKLTAEGKVSKIIGYQVKFNGIGFRGPYHIDINDSLRRVYVVDRDNNRVVVFNMNGDFLFTFGEKGDNHGEFDFPHEIDVSDKDGKIYIADTNNKRIQVFSNSGEYLDKIQIQSGYANPKTVASSSSGLLISGHLGVDAYMVLWKNPTVNYSSRGELSLHSNQNYDTITHNKTYDKFCSSCHMEGSLGAPRFGIESEWQRFPQDINVLLNLVKAGRGSMLKNGGCDLCTDKDLIDAISSMLPSKWASVKN